MRKTITTIMILLVLLVSVFAEDGYPETEATDAGLVTMSVNPDPGSMNLNIYNLVKESNGKANVAELKIFATSAKQTKWDDKLVTFLSASSDYLDNSKSFVLKNNRTNQTIPFSVTIYDEQGVEVKTFNGKTKYTGRMSDCIDLTPYMTTVENKEGNPTYSIVFIGTVGITLNVTTDEVDADALNGLYRYPGMYTSNIYYHIVTNDNTK